MLYFFSGGAVTISGKFIDFFTAFLRLYRGNRLNTASAALSYYLTMTAFPLLICLYTMLGNSHESALRIVRLASGILAPDTIKLIEDFLDYISSNNSTAMLIAGLLVLVSYASSALRSIQGTLCAMQGGHKYSGLRHYAFSVVFSLVFLSAMYFAVLAMLSGGQFIAFVNRAVPFLDISKGWVFVRFVALAGIFFLVVWSIYEMPKRSTDSYSTFMGAILAALAMLAVSMCFSFVISRSSNYPLVYGSLASIILLMLWLYSCCTVIYCGAAVNIAIRDMKNG